MMGSVFSKTLYDLRWTLIAFCVGLATLAFFIMLIFPTVAEAQNDMMQGMSADLARVVLGGEHLIGTPEGHLNVQLFAFHPLYIAVFLIIATSAAIAGEDNARTLGILMARPVARWRVLLEKAGAILLGLVLITAAIVVGLFIGGFAASVDISYVDLALSMIYTLPYGIWLAGFGLLCSAIFRSRMTAALVATGVVIFGYMLNSMTEFVPSLKEYNYASPIYYYSWAEPLVRTPKYDNMALLIGVGLLCMAGALVAFQRREIHG